MLFHPINLVVGYLLNKNKFQLLAIFENCSNEVAKQLLNFLAVFELEPLAL